VHSLLGGLADEARAAGTEGNGAAGEAGKVANVLGRIKQLSPEEIRALLEANRAKQGRND